ncbi:coenzyme PQQ synthesis protein B [Saccharopolyspora subtropica]|uniref:Coenzyme PQQ synthesis protein B n=1 Tax=Saccharopolyspora thermophila TaxID=89367 RepID=A0A917JWH3_9PSEU|nr:pyrroloquinoline quinone biosynthesis protein PqqB [Saccharopolyspora subtropica]GGI89550.1 coenzyme PQQ synthesis protein B [Saccharopolyspora subtropica]
MRVRVLGTAAGGGLPQWNCGCRSCLHARETGQWRTQDCLAVSGDDATWFLVNAAPDLRTQLLTTPELQPPPGTRRTPIAGVLLSTAELDHALGLVTLREAEQLRLYATAAVHRALEPVTGMISAYTDLRQEVVTGELELPGGLTARATGVGEKRPRYAAGLAGRDWVVAYRFTDTATGRSLVYAPCLPDWNAAFAEVVDGADVVLLDGTFFTEDELTRTSGRDRPARSMGHLPVCASLPEIARRPRTRFMFTHLNNTNPLAHPDSPELAEVHAAGAGVAADGQLVELR